jgi:large subunit ribosomal protein L18
MGLGTRGKSKSAATSRRHTRLRKKVVGTELRPRLVVNRSARHVFVQVVDDSKGHTVASASTLEADMRTFDGDKTAKAKSSSPSAPRLPESTRSSSTAVVTNTPDA